MVQKCVSGIAGSVESIKKLRSGSILIQSRNRQESVNLLAVKHFAVKVTPHKTLNSSKCIIRDLERVMFDMSENEIAEQLKEQGVT